MMRRVMIGVGATMVFVGLAGCDEPSVRVVDDPGTEPITTTTTTLPPEPTVTRVVRPGTQPQQPTTTTIRRAPTTTTTLIETAQFHDDREPVATVEPPHTRFDDYTDARTASETLRTDCGATTRPCHIPQLEYEAAQPTLRTLVGRFFEPEDQGWAIRTAFCESSGQPDDWYSDAVNDDSGSTGWFQHLPQYWDDRSIKAGFSGFPANHPVANVGVAAWLLYSTPQGKGHWWPSRSCWENK